MVSFLLSIVALIIGYFTYGKLVERIFVIDSNKVTPACEFEDGVDFIILPNWKVFLIQFLNIAGLGPIFGAIAGAMFGPSAFLWIVLGSIFAGGVHDYFSGMLSLRNNGGSISEVTGKYLGGNMKFIMRLFTIVLLIFVGTVFLMGPAKIIDGMTNLSWGVGGWTIVILCYYILSTLLPIDKLISKLYPLFGIAMLIMAVGLFVALIFGDYTIPEITLSSIGNMHANSNETPIFPILFVTISCGAISGFHATQSPLMARCMNNEKQGRKIFYGTMVTEGVVALIWAAAAMTFFENVNGLNEVMINNNNNAAWVANEILINMLGNIGGFLALLGIVVAPITSGDTAFRSSRLIIADIFKIDQKKLINRIYISIPLFLIAIILTQIDFSIIWRYFAWSNQALATINLWTITAFLYYNSKNYGVAFIPSVFMTMVCCIYILIAPEGLKLSSTYAYVGGFIATLLITIIFMVIMRKNKLYSTGLA